MLLNSREQRVADRVPVVEHAVRAAEEARAEHASALPSTMGSSSTGQSCGSYSRSASWTMTISPVLGGERGADRLALPAVLLLQDELVDVAGGVQLDEPLARAVGRAVVHADDLLPHRRRVHAIEDRLDRVALVVHRDEHGESYRTWVERRELAWLGGERELACRGWNRGHRGRDGEGGASRESLAELKAVRLFGGQAASRRRSALPASTTTVRTGYASSRGSSPSSHVLLRRIVVKVLCRCQRDYRQRSASGVQPDGALVLGGDELVGRGVRGDPLHGGRERGRIRPPDARPPTAANRRAARTRA